VQADPNVVVTTVSAKISTVRADFQETLDLPALMTVVRHGDVVIFHNPVFCSKETYEELGKDAKRVIIHFPTAFHHMAADIAMAAFPKAELWGSPSTGDRHNPQLEVKDTRDGFDVEGFKVASLAGCAYDERWLLFEPEGVMLFGDLVPGVTEAMDIPAWWADCGRSIAGVCEKSSMLSYQRCFCTNHDEIIAELKKVLSWNLKACYGCHPGHDIDVYEDMATYWSWLLPAGDYSAKAAGVQLT